MVDGNAVINAGHAEHRSTLISKTAHERSIQDLKQTISDVRKRHEILQADAKDTRSRLQSRIDDLENKLRAAAASVEQARSGQRDSELEKARLARQGERLNGDVRKLEATIARLREVSPEVVVVRRAPLIRLSRS